MSELTITEPPIYETSPGEKLQGARKFLSVSTLGDVRQIYLVQTKIQ